MLIDQFREAVMEVKPLEVYAEDSNYGVVRMPGRNYPGAVVQGDSLAILWRKARAVVKGIETGATAGEEFLAAAEELHNSLLDRLLHYQRVIQQAGFDLPYVRPVSEDFANVEYDEGKGASEGSDS
jgi:hypothetical protein